MVVSAQQIYRGRQRVGGRGIRQVSRSSRLSSRRMAHQCYRVGEQEPPSISAEFWALPSVFQLEGSLRIRQ